MGSWDKKNVFELYFRCCSKHFEVGDDVTQQVCFNLSSTVWMIPAQSVRCIFSSLHCFLQLFSSMTFSTHTHLILPTSRRFKTQVERTQKIRRNCPQKKRRFGGFISVSVKFGLLKFLHVQLEFYIALLPNWQLRYRWRDSSTHRRNWTIRIIKKRTAVRRWT